MMKNIIKTMFISLLATSGVASAQSNLLNAKTAGEIGNTNLEEVWSKDTKPRPYQYVNERDLIFEKKVWETIPADQKFNLQYFLPLEASGEFKPLFDVLMEGIRTGEITEVYEYYDFTQRLNLEQLKTKFSKDVITDEGIEQANLGLEVSDEYKLSYELTSNDVKEYKIMGSWYFDRMAGELKYRLLGICPVVVDIETKGTDNESTADLFWIFFPNARNTLYKNYAYNSRNLRIKSSFDYLLNSRRFNSTIYQTDNLYGDVKISDYVRDNAMLQLLEAERIKESIREFENDLSSY